MITVGAFLTKITPKLRGTTLSRLTTKYEKLSESMGILLTNIDPPTTVRTEVISNAIYDRVYNYSGMSDLKGTTKLIDIRPIGERSTSDDIVGRFPKQFDIKKERNTATIEYVNEVKTLRLSKELTPRTVLHRADSLTLEGAVTGSGDVQNLTTNTLDKISGGSSIQFGLDGSTGTGTLTFALNNSIDLSKLEDLGSLFHWFKFPDASRLTSVKLVWGSSASDNWDKTVTAAHDRAFASNAWLLNRYDWTTADNENGTPVASAVDYLQIVFTYTAGVALENVRVDNITAALGEVWEAVYYADTGFKGADGTYKTLPTANTDTILLDEQAINILIAEFMKIALHEQKGAKAKYDYQFYNQQLWGSRDKVNSEPGLYDRYEQDNPSLVIPSQVSYHEFGDLSEDNVGDQYGFED